MKQLRGHILPTLLATSVVLAACSSQTFLAESADLGRTLSEMTGQDGRACLLVRDIRGYGAISDNLLSLSSIRMNHYLLVTTYRCPVLETSPAALFEGAFTELCGGGRDFVSTGGERCSIRSIFEFENRDAAFAAIDEARRKIANADNAAMAD